jgi:hypothetical protein
VCLLENSRHRTKDRWSNLIDLAHDCRRLYVSIARRTCHCSPAQRTCSHTTGVRCCISIRNTRVERYDSLGNMCHWQERIYQIVFVREEWLTTARGVGDQVSMRNHHSFGVASGSRRVHNDGGAIVTILLQSIVPHIVRNACLLESMAVAVTGRSMAAQYTAVAAAAAAAAAAAVAAAAAATYLLKGITSGLSASSLAISSLHGTTARNSGHWSATANTSRTSPLV